MTATSTAHPEWLHNELLVALDGGGGQPTRVSPNSVRLALERLIPDALRTTALIFVPAICFAVATARRRTTFGKRLLGLRVVRLDGRPVSLFEGVEPFGAYLGILETLGLGLFDLWRDRAHASAVSLSSCGRHHWI